MNPQKIIITGILIWFFTINLFSQNQVVYDNSLGNNDGYLGSNENYEDSDPWQVDGKFGKALDFDGADDFVLIPDSDCSNLDISGGPLTISAWVNPDSHSASGKTRSIAGKGNTQYKLGQNKDGWEFSIFDNDGFHTIQSLDKPEPGKWTHLVGRYDPESDDLSLWVNGEKQNNTGVSGGAEPGSFMNLETPVANPHSGETVSVNDFGALPDDGQDDTEAIQQAFNSGKNVMFPDGVYNISGNLNINNADMADKTIFAENNLEATIQASDATINCHYFYNINGLVFKKIELAIYGGDNKNQTRFIQNNKFEKPYQTGGQIITILRNEKVENLVIKSNSFIGGTFGINFGRNGGSGMIKNSYIENNYSEGIRRHYIFRSGVVNVKIRNNILQGEDSLVAHHPFTHKDMVGIGFFLYKSNSPLIGNIIENNTFYDIYEEGISFDAFGRNPDSYSRWNGDVEDWESSEGEITRLYLSSTPSSNEWNGGSGYNNYRVIFLEDGSPLKGKSAKITNAGINDGRTFIDIKGGIEANLLDHSQHCMILAQIPRNFLIRNNYMERIGRTGINAGAGFNYLIEKNTIIDCNLQEDTHPTHRLRWGGISVKNPEVMNAPGEYSPSFYHSVMNNTLSGSADDSEYGTDLTYYTNGNVYQSYANTYCGNTFLDGAGLVIEGDIEPCGPSSNYSDVAIGYNAQTRGEYFDGKLDDVRIFRRALSDEEVKKLANGEDIGNTFLFGSWKFDSLLQSMPSSSVKKKITDNKTVSIYPNPTSGTLNLRFNSESKTKSLEIIDLLGNKIKTMELNEVTEHNEVYHIDVSRMKPGLYLLNVLSGKSILTRRFQVVH